MEFVAALGSPVGRYCWHCCGSYALSSLFCLLGFQLFSRGLVSQISGFLAELSRSLVKLSSSLFGAFFELCGVSREGFNKLVVVIGVHCWLLVGCGADFRSFVEVSSGGALTPRVRGQFWKVCPGTFLWLTCPTTLLA